MNKKELEDTIKNLKISGYDIRMSIDVNEQKVMQLKQQYNQVVAEIQKFAKELLEIQEKDKKDGNDGNTSK